jgi:hypothetical protein
MSHPFPFVRPPPTQIPTMVPPGFIMAAQAPFGMSVGVAMPHSQFQPGCIVQNQMPVSSVHGNRFPFPSRYPYQPQTVRFPTQIPPKNISSSDGANWELMVDAFVRKTTSGIPFLGNLV